jgi:hypothetical protein
MNNLKTLTLAAAAALSLGLGTAMAQDGNGGTYPDYQSLRVLQQTRPTSFPVTTQPQSGSSDVDTMRGGADHSATEILNNHLYDAGGVSG